MTVTCMNGNRTNKFKGCRVTIYDKDKNIVDRFEVPENRESLWYRTKASVFCTLYLFSALAFLFVLVIILEF